MRHTNDYFSVSFFGNGHSGSGWYWWSTDYPEDGSNGPFPSLEKAYTDAWQTDPNNHSSAGIPEQPPISGYTKPSEAE